MSAIVSFLLKSLKTAAIQKLLLEAGELLVKRTDTSFDDKALEVVKEVVEKTSIFK